MKKFLFNLLQLFTYDPQAQPINNTTANTPGNDLSPEDKTYYDRQLIRMAQARLVHMQFGQERDIPERAGQTIEFRKFSSLGKALQPLTEGVTPDPQALDVTAITATVQQYGGFVAYTDKLKLASIDPIITETVQLIGDQAGLTLDTVVRDILNTGSNVAYASTFSGGTETEVVYRHKLDQTAKLTVKEVEKQVTELRSQNAPTIDGEYYICITHPKSLFDLMRDPEWRDVQKYTDENVKKAYKGEVGAIGGCRFVSTTEAKIFYGDDLLSTSRTMTVASNASAAATSLVTSETPTDDLVNRYIIVGGNRYKITAVNTGTKTLTITPGLEGAASANDVIYPGEGGAGGIGVFSCLFFGKNAYGKTKITGGGLKTIIKQLGSAGTADPLDQRATIGWKALMTAKILVPEYIRRLEVGGTYATANLKAN